MKNWCLLLLLVVSATTVRAQTASAKLDANQAGALIVNAPWLWNDWNFGRGLQIPRDTSTSTTRPPSRKKTVFAASMWLGALDTNDTLYVAAETYRQGAPYQRGFWAGPMATHFAQPGDDPAYSFVWKVSRAQIDAHRAGYAQPGYVVPAELAAWPARPAGYTGISALAPFVDANANGFYDPAGGDYPNVPGDQAIFFIANDAADSKVPVSRPLGVEVQGLVYAFNAGTCSAALDYTVFVRYQLTNHSPRTYHDTYAGHFVDFEIGTFGSDDYVGCDSTRQMGFGYNQSPLDPAYGTSPMQAVVALSTPLAGFQSYDNTPGATMTGNPTAALHFYDYLRGRWLDGSPVRVGGNGYGGAGRATRWMYPGDPVANTGWTEGNTNGQGAANAPGDRRSLLTFGPFSFQPGETRTLDLAYVFADTPAAMPAAVDAVRQCVTNGLLATRPDVRPAPAFTLTPNPARATVRLTLGSAPAAPQTVLVLDALGRVVREQMLRAVEATLELRGLAPGLYTVRVGAAARKLVVE